jgi:tRNA U55 pseudouridine synthase TruB
MLTFRLWMWMWLSSAPRGHTFVRWLATSVVTWGSGGHLTALRRTATGPWKIEQCHDLEDLFAGDAEGEALPLIALDRAAQTLFPTLVVTREAAARFRNGQAPGSGEVIDTLPGGSANPKFPDIRALVPVGDQSHVLGLVRVVEGTTLDLKTVSVFAQ